MHNFATAQHALAASQFPSLVRKWPSWLLQLDQRIFLNSPRLCSMWSNTPVCPSGAPWAHSKTCPFENSTLVVGHDEPCRGKTLCSVRIHWNPCEQSRPPVPATASASASLTDALTHRMIRTHLVVNACFSAGRLLLYRTLFRSPSPSLSRDAYLSCWDRQSTSDPWSRRDDGLAHVAAFN